MSLILIGTSGFSYDDWKATFYPPEITKKEYLTFYASHFKALELNFSYYQMPKAHHCAQMLAKTGGELTFVVKAFNKITHEIDEKSLKETLSRFIDGISPFIDAERLGGILLQFPQSFHYRPENRIYLKTLLDNLVSYPVFVEFRQKEWLKETVFRALRELNTGFVCVDEPLLPSLIPPIVMDTSRMGYIRFHGRNMKNWYGTDSTARYNYLYSKEELSEWVPKIR
ncbi:MAG: DUF72 domain-containing protein, partial [Pseudomonadota bacterium]